MHDLTFPVITMADVAERERALSDEEREPFRGLAGLPRRDPLEHMKELLDAAAMTFTSLTPRDLLPASGILMRRREAMLRAANPPVVVCFGGDYALLDDREILRNSEEAIAKDKALDRLRSSLEVARSCGIDGYSITGSPIGKTAVELDEMDARLADAIRAHRPTPHVTLKANPVKAVKPAISGLSVVKG